MTTELSNSCVPYVRLRCSVQVLELKTHAFHFTKGVTAMTNKIDSLGLSNSSFQQKLPDSNGNQQAAMLVVAVVREIDHMQVGTVQSQMQQWGRVSVAW